MDDNFDNFELNLTFTYHVDACYNVAWSTASGTFKFYVIALLVIIVVGLVCNALSIRVFTAREMRVVPSNVYLLSLAVSHTLFLLLAFFNMELQVLHCWFSPSTATPPLTHRSLFVCASLHFISVMTLDFSSWMIVAFAADRLMAMLTPIFYKHRCTVAPACCVTVVIFVIATAATAPFHTTDLQIIEGGLCVTRFNSHFENFLHVLGMVTAYLFPTVVIVIMVELVVIHMCLVRRTKKLRRTQSTQNDGGDEMIEGNPLVATEDQDMENEQRVHRKRKLKYPPSDDERNRQLNVILILISVTHCVLRLPLIVSMFVASMFVSHEGGIRIVEIYCSLLSASSFAVNFFLYTLSGSIFREQLKAVCRCGWRGDQRGESSTAPAQPAAQSEVQI